MSSNYYNQKRRIIADLKGDDVALRLALFLLWCEHIKINPPEDLDIYNIRNNTENYATH